MSTVEMDETQRLSKLLERVAELQSDKDKMSAELSMINKKLKDAEGLAVEALAASGLDGCRAAGKSWFTREFWSVSVPTENRKRVVEAAQAEGLEDFVTVNTATLKSWLAERKRQADNDEGGFVGLAEGTLFDGLITEFREMRLSHRTVG